MTLSNHRMKKAERGCARATDEVFQTHELMLCGPVAESELRVARTFSTFLGAKDRIQEQLGMDVGEAHSGDRLNKTPSSFGGRQV